MYHCMTRDVKRRGLSNCMTSSTRRDTVARLSYFYNTSSPMCNDRLPGSQNYVWRHHNLRCSKADNSELETVPRN